MRPFDAQISNSRRITNENVEKNGEWKKTSYRPPCIAGSVAVSLRRRRSMSPSSVPTRKVGLDWVFVSFRFRPMGGEGESATVDGKYDLGCDIFKTHIPSRYSPPAQSAYTSASSSSSACSTSFCRAGRWFIELGELSLIDGYTF